MRPLPTCTVEIPTADGFAVEGDLYTPPDNAPSAVVVLCHGFKGYRTWGFLPYVAGRLRDAGLAACALDFSFNGVASAVHPDSTTPKARPVPKRGPRYARPDLFRMNTLAREIEDLALTLCGASENGLGGCVDASLPIGLFAHSRGGVSAMVNASKNERVRALCTWSAPDHPDHFTARQKALWRRYGEYDFTDAVDGTRLSLSSAYLDDLEKNHENYDLKRRAADLHVPYLIVHGEMDLAVPVRCAHALHDAASSRADRRLVILRTGHTFGVNDPPGMSFDDPPLGLVHACDATVAWLEKHLKGGR
jgi:dienelactone hydrolase